MAVRVSSAMILPSASTMRVPYLTCVFWGFMSSRGVAMAAMTITAMPAAIHFLFLVNSKAVSLRICRVYIRYRRRTYRSFIVCWPTIFLIIVYIFEATKIENVPIQKRRTAEWGGSIIQVRAMGGLNPPIIVGEYNKVFCIFQSRGRKENE